MALLLAAGAGWQWIRATELLVEAQRKDSLLLASHSEQETARGNAVNGMLLALQGLPTRFDVRRWTNWKDPVGPDRPVVPETVGALIEAMAEQRELALWGRHPLPKNTDHALAVTRAPSLILVVDRDGVRLVNSANGTDAGRLHPISPEARPFGLVVDTKRNRAITTRAYMGVDFWDINTMKHIKFLQVQSKNPLTLTLNINEDILAAGSEDHSIYLIDMESMEIVNRLEVGGRIMATAFSPDGSQLASAVMQRGVLLWSSTNWRSAKSAANWRPIELTTGEEYQDAINMAFSPGGQRLAVAYRQGGVVVWNVSAPDKPLIEGIEGLTGSASTVAFATSGQVLAAGYGDGSIRVVDLEADRTEVAPFV
jgi:hypothetical protein